MPKSSAAGMGSRAGEGERQGGGLLPRPLREFLYVAIRKFFYDLQAWQWIPAVLNPRVNLATLRAVKKLMEPNPRTIDDDLWALLLWAGVALFEDDLRGQSIGYPIEMIRAAAVTWLFAGLRSNELQRLRKGCVRWLISGSVGSKLDEDEGLRNSALCLLYVPISKSNKSYSKPVDRIVGEAIEAWEKVRGDQPKMLDKKTSEEVHFLFCYNSLRMAKTYLNEKIIPLICRKAGVALEDSRGRITSHRARSTIATQLSETMTLSQLTAWLGNKSLESMRHYIKVSEGTLVISYKRSDYYGRNLRTGKVLLEQRESMESENDAGRDEFDLGPGFCTYPHFESCPHLAACIKCVFFRPKPGTDQPFFEAEENLRALRNTGDLSERQIAAVEVAERSLKNLRNQFDMRTFGEEERGLHVTTIKKVPDCPLLAAK
jgi:integrase